MSKKPSFSLRSLLFLFIMFIVMRMFSQIVAPAMKANNAESVSGSTTRGQHSS